MATPKYNWKWILRSFSTAHPRVCTLFVALCINAVVPASLSVCAFSIELECLCHSWHALQWTFLTCDGGLPHLHPYRHSPFFLRFEVSIGSGLDFLSLASSFMFFVFFCVWNIWRLLRMYGWKKWKKKWVKCTFFLRLGHVHGYWLTFFQIVHLLVFLNFIYVPSFSSSSFFYNFDMHKMSCYDQCACRQMMWDKTYTLEFSLLSVRSFRFCMMTASVE